MHVLCHACRQRKGLEEEVRWTAQTDLISLVNISDYQTHTHIQFQSCDHMVAAAALLWVNVHMAENGEVNMMKNTDHDAARGTARQKQNMFLSSFSIHGTNKPIPTSHNILTQHTTAAHMVRHYVLGLGTTTKTFCTTNAIII